VASGQLNPTAFEPSRILSLLACHWRLASALRIPDTGQDARDTHRGFGYFELEREVTLQRMPQNPVIRLTLGGELH